MRGNKGTTVLAHSHTEHADLQASKHHEERYKNTHSCPELRLSKACSSELKRKQTDDLKLVWRHHKIKCYPTSRDIISFISFILYANESSNVKCKCPSWILDFSELIGLISLHWATLTAFSGYKWFLLLLWIIVLSDKMEKKNLQKM